MSGSSNLNSFRDRGQVAVQLVSCGVLFNPAVSREYRNLVCLVFIKLGRSAFEIFFLIGCQTATLFMGLNVLKFYPCLTSLVFCLSLCFSFFFYLNFSSFSFNPVFGLLFFPFFLLTRVIWKDFSRPMFLHSIAAKTTDSWVRNINRSWIVDPYGKNPFHHLCKCAYIYKQVHIMHVCAYIYSNKYLFCVGFL